MVIAVLMRPAGGALSDRYGPVRVLVVVFGVSAVLAAVAAAEFDLAPIGTLAFLGMAAALGAGSGGVFALVATSVQPEKVGAVTGVVGAAGGLGGLFRLWSWGRSSPLLAIYSWGYILLSVTAAVACLYTATVVRRRVREHKSV